MPLRRENVPIGSDTEVIVVRSYAKASLTPPITLPPMSLTRAIRERHLATNNDVIYVRVVVAPGEDHAGCEVVRKSQQWYAVTQVDVATGEAIDQSETARLLAAQVQRLLPKQS